MNSTVEVVIVDDQNLFAQGFKNILESIENVKVISIIRSGEDIKDQLYILKPKVLFLDLNLPGINGVEILRSIRNHFPLLIISILTIYEDQLLINRARELGANAYLSKDATVEELNQVLFSTPGQKFFVSEKLCTENCSNSVIKETLPDKFKDIALITSRENEIIQLIADGKSTEEIAKSLFISSETVKSHRKNIFRKLNLNKVPELLKFAYENHLL